MSIEQSRQQPLTRPQAQKLRDQYIHLKSSIIYFDEVEYVVDCVAVSPYDEINKWVFLHYYIDYKDVHKSLAFYMVPFFDVVLILYPVAKKLEYRYLDLSSYLKMSNTAVNR